jgi:Flp pilus assembly protein TadD
LKYYLRTLSVDGSRPGLHLLTGRLLEEKGHLKEAVRVMRDGANLHPHDLDLIESLAGILATSSNAEVRDGEDAVRWGRLVVAARGERHARSRLTLASALAEAGQFEEAVATARQALAIAEADGDQPMIAEAKRRLELFVQERPFHERERG